MCDDILQCLQTISNGLPNRPIYRQTGRDGAWNRVGIEVRCHQTCVNTQPSETCEATETAVSKYRLGMNTPTSKKNFADEIVHQITHRK